MKLQIKDLHFSYKNLAEEGAKLFSNVNLEFMAGDIVAIEGENGSGKTTILKILSCILEGYQGDITLDGINIKDKKYRKSMAYIPDTPILFDELTGEEHLLLFCDLWELKKENKEKYTLRVKELSSYLLLDKFLKEKVRIYSLGTKYKLFLILMLARSPKLILLDEPLTSLDFESQSKTIDLLKKISKNAVIIMSSHQEELIAKLATSRFKIMNKNFIQL